MFVLQGYLMALGKKRTEEVKRDARMGEAEATRDSGIQVMYIVSKRCPGDL